MVLSDKINFISLLVLIVTCAAVLVVAVPTITYNINDPNMLIYFQADEGGFMDVIWHYYSGQKRPSHQWDFDYGLELVYLADIGRTLSPFVNFTPGLFVLILRWLHLLSWIGALIAIWYFMGYHFGKGWQQTAIVLLLGTCPAFMYFLHNLKPEPLVLLLMILGLHYTLKIVSKPSGWYVVFAAAFASLAYIVKFAGVFLIPAIVAAIYLGRRYNEDKASGWISMASKSRIAWAIPMVVGTALLAGTLLVIMCYVRRSTGGTWFQEYGLWGSLLRNKIGLVLFIAGIASYFTGGILWLMGGSNSRSLKQVMAQVDEIGCYIIAAIILFIGFTAIFGFRWFMNPSYFILTCAFLGFALPLSTAVLAMPQAGFINSFISNLKFEVLEFGIIPLLLFGFYIYSEFFMKKMPERSDREMYLKRMVLIIFSLPLLVCMLSMMRMVKHHMLPFFVSVSVLSIQGIWLFASSFFGRKTIKRAVMALVIILFISDVSANTAYIFKGQLNFFHLKDDIAFDIARWWKENIPKDALVLSGHYTQVYVPLWHEKVVTFDILANNGPAQLRGLVDKYHPAFLYYNDGDIFGKKLPHLDEMLPGRKFKLLMSFESNSKRYQRMPGARFVIYKMMYD